ncbi:MAG TPA: cytochrome c [Kofleriaceae bacterium]|nr:cytochrome c [Kofleriaceae bacterium]
MRAAALLLVPLLVLAACGDDPARYQVLGGERVSLDRLVRGERLYERYCAACHGARGDGLGPSSAFQWPPPRDFRTADFKFAASAEGELPPDDEIAAVVRRGLAGTAMLAWDIPDAELADVIDYIKSFSPRGRGFRDRSRRQVRPPVPPDPFAGPGGAARAIAEGARLYHAEFQCNQCHPTYARREQLAAWGAADRSTFPGEPVPRWSATYRSVLLPPDFMRHPMRFARTAADFYRIIAGGMRGPMPAYGQLGGDKVWAVARYTAWLVSQRR